MEKEEILSKVQQICDTLTSEMETLSHYDRVSHLSQSKIQFQGGILGGIREYRESKRLEKLMNQPIVGDLSFYKYAFHLIEKAEELTKLLLEYQKTVGEADENYYTPVEAAINVTMKAVSTWYNLSPDMADASITIGSEKNVALAPTVRGYVKDEFAKLDLPESLQPLKKADMESSNGGCFGMLLFLLSAGASGLAMMFAFIL